MPRNPEAQDPRDVGTYSVAEAGRYLRIPTATVRSWICGRRYPTKHQERFWPAVIALTDEASGLLSFTNLVEAHILSALRTKYGVRMDKVRQALAFLGDSESLKHPLAQQVLETDGFDLFVERYGMLINASSKGQLEMSRVMRHYLERVERDRSGMAARLFPFTRPSLTGPSLVVIDPLRSFGRPVIVDQGIPTAVVSDRYRAGESVSDLARDYHCEELAIEEAIRCELPQAA